MISLASLWLPILLSAVAIFIVSSIIHMLFTYHRSNFVAISQEKEFCDKVRPFNIPPGEYMYPYAQTPKEMSSDAFLEKLNNGPVGMLTVLPNAPFAMGKSLLVWFIYSLIVSTFSAYIAVQSLTPGASYLAVMQIVGATAFAGYSLAHMQNSIWYSRAWSTTFKFMFDGAIYALFTGGIFGWLWPAVI